MLLYSSVYFHLYLWESLRRCIAYWHSVKFCLFFLHNTSFLCCCISSLRILMMSFFLHYVRLLCFLTTLSIMASNSLGPWLLFLNVFLIIVLYTLLGTLGTVIFLCCINSKCTHKSVSILSLPLENVLDVKIRSSPDIWFNYI